MFDHNRQFSGFFLVVLISTIFVLIIVRLAYPCDPIQPQTIDGYTTSSVRAGVDIWGGPYSSTRCWDTVTKIMESTAPGRYVITAVEAYAIYGGGAFCEFAYNAIIFPVNTPDTTKCKFMSDWGDFWLCSDSAVKPQLDGCSGFDTNELIVDSSRCYELGRSVSDPSLIVSSVQVYGTKNGHFEYQHFMTSTTDGCAGVDINGTPLTKGNARDTSYTVDGVNLKGCLYGGAMLSGSCAENGLDTSCGGEIPYSFQNGDSIINPCNQLEDKPPLFSDSLTGNRSSIDGIERDTSYSGKTVGTADSIYVDALNKIMGKLDTSNIINKSNGGILSNIKNALIAGFDAIGGKLNQLIAGISGLGGSDSSAVNGLRNDLDGVFRHDTSTGDDYTPDTSFGGGWLDVNSDDSLNTFIKLHSKLDSLRALDSLDTNIFVDTAIVRDMFSAFVVDMGDTSGCECDSSLTQFVIMGHNYNLNICSYNVAQYTKPIFRLLAVALVFWFYWFMFFDILTKMFKS